MTETSEPLNADPRVQAAVQDYLERIDRGEAVDRERFLAKYPDIAEAVRSFITGSEELAEFAKRSDASAISTNSVATDASQVKPSSKPTVFDRSKFDALPAEFGRYRIIKLLGRGAMGAVFLADDRQLERQVALKIPSFDEDQTGELLTRFYREARSAALLRQPNICPVYDVGEIDGQHYITMAYIAGLTLAELIKSDKPPGERQALLIVRKLAIALQEAHNQSIIHRDLKPGNVMIDARGEPIVMDFGLACRVETGDAARLTHSGVIVGSPAYMSPEQIEGNPDKLTAAADQYSLGVILYEMLTGQLPFKGSITAVIAQITTKAPQPPRQLRPDVDPRVEAVCLRMMAKKAADRFSSLKAVADELATILREPKSSASVPVIPKETNTPPAIAPAERSIVKQLSVAARWKTETSEVLELARRLVKKHDYVDAAQLLEKIPAAYRNTAVLELLDQATERQEECDALLRDIDQAVRKELPKELPALVKRFLQLKPGHTGIQRLAADIKQHGVESAMRVRKGDRKYLDPAGQVWNPLHAVFAAGGLLTLCAAVYFTVIMFQTKFGTVVVEVHDPFLKVGFADDTISLETSGKKYQLKPTAEQTLEIEHDGLVLVSPKVLVKRGGTTQVVATMQGGKPVVTIDGALQTLTPKPATEMAQTASDLQPSKESAWIDLLNSFDIDRHNGPNNAWSRENGVVIGKLGPNRNEGWTGFKSAGTINGDYDLEVELLTLGVTQASISLPLNETSARLTIGPNTATMHWIDGKTGDEVSGGRYHTSNLKLPADERVTVTASVRHSGDDVAVEYAINGVTTAKYNGKRSRLSIPEQFVPGHGQVQVTVHFPEKKPDSRLELHRVRLRPASPNRGSADLFNGRDLAGWRQSPPEPSQWRVKDGVLNGESTATASFLISDRGDYRNFRLTARVMYESTNSGLFFRAVQNGEAVHGYEAELISKSQSGGTGNLFLVGGKSLSASVLADGPFPAPGTWFTYTVECVDNEITIGIDGRTVLKHRDQTAHATSGHIMLQAYKGPIRYQSLSIIELSDKNAGAGFTDLFNGRDLTGWNGEAQYWTVKDGVLSTSNIQSQRPVYLLTDREFSDFDLQLQFKLMNDGNSGVQYRSQRAPNDQIDGPQAEIGFLSLDGTGFRNITGDIFVPLLRRNPGSQPAPSEDVMVDLIRRSFLSHAEGNRREKTDAVYRHRDWNDLTVRCIGDSEVVFLNGRKTADIKRADGNRSGKIGFQLWGNRNGRFAVAPDVQYRNIRVLDLSTPAASSASADGFTSLDHLSQWSIRASYPDPKSPTRFPTHLSSSGGWQNRDGSIVCATNLPGWLRSQKEYRDFVLQMDYKMPPKGNSGLLIRTPETGHLPSVGMEIQLIDDAREDVGLALGNGSGSIASGGSPASKAAAKPAGEWNTIEVTCRGDQVLVKLNDQIVNDVNLATNDTLKNRPRQGYIGLYNWQGEALGCEFRNIRIKELSPAISSSSGGSNGSVQLFNGINFEGWTQAVNQEWRIADQSLVSDSGSRGTLWTKREYGDFQLDFEYRLSAGANSGVFLRSGTAKDWTDFELQLLDQPQFPDLPPIQRNGAIYDVAAPTFQPYRPGEWNAARVRLEGRQMNVSLNGQTVHNRSLDDFRSEFLRFPSLKRTAGYIGLQTYGRSKGADKVEFRNVMLQELSGASTTPVASTTPPKVVIGAAAPPPKPKKVTWLIPTSEQEPQEWLCRMGDNLLSPETYLESVRGFSTRKGPFGNGINGIKFGCKWDKPHIALRKTVEVPDLAGKSLVFRIFHDDSVWIYVNGKELNFTPISGQKQLGGATTSYVEVPVSAENQKAFVAGTNRIIVWCENVAGPQMIDVGLKIVE